jgi:hypothetical protein
VSALASRLQLKQSGRTSQEDFGFMATKLTETPIKHTAGGEMPDPNEQHHVSAEELETLGGVEGRAESASFLDKTKNYLPVVLGALGIGLGIYFLMQRFNRGDLEGKLKDEGKRALDIDDVPPSRLMGA